MFIDLNYYKDKPRIATGKKTRPSSIYKPNQPDDFKISRSRFQNFKDCKRCFYLDLVRGYVAPDSIPQKLNSLTDTLLKKEFDLCRKKNNPHRLLKKNKKLQHIIPYKNDNHAKNIYEKLIVHSKTKKPYKLLDAWRSTHHGLQRRFKNTNIILYGIIDDVWQNKKTNELILADYKSQQSKVEVTQENYFESVYKKAYETQMNFYFYLLNGDIKKINNIKNEVSKDTYFYVMNAKGLEDGFNGKLLFEEKIIHHRVNIDGLEKEIQEMVDTINSEKIPESAFNCINCAYAKIRSRIE